MTDRTVELARTMGMVLLRQIQDRDFKLDKAFENELFSAGILAIPKESEKPNKNSKDNVLVSALAYENRRW